MNDTTEDKPLEEKKENESSPATNQDGQKDDSSSSENESELQANSSPGECTEIKTTVASDGSEEPTKTEDPEPSGMENGITPDSQSDAEQIETSQTVSSVEVSVL